MRQRPRRLSPTGLASAYLPGSPTDFQIDGPDISQGPVGTIFDARVPAEHADRLNSEAALYGITAEFALFLTLHPEVSIVYRGDALDPVHAQIHTAEYVLDSVEEAEGEQLSGPGSLRISGTTHEGPSLRP